METYQKKTPAPEAPALPHRISLSDRREMHLTGVREVLKFDDETVSLATSCGELTVRGNGLKIGSLNVENGELKLNGSIDALVYSADRGDVRGIRRLFR